MDPVLGHDTPIGVPQAAHTNRPGHALGPEIEVSGAESAHRPAGSGTKSQPDLVCPHWAPRTPLEVGRWRTDGRVQPVADGLEALPLG